MLRRIPNEKYDNSSPDNVSSSSDGGLRLKTEESHHPEKANMPG